MFIQSREFYKFSLLTGAINALVCWILYLSDAPIGLVAMVFLGICLASAYYSIGRIP